MTFPLWFWILGWFLTLVAVAGNGLVICLITARRRLHITTNWFILSLAVADFLFSSTYFSLSHACAIIDSCNSDLRRAVVYTLSFISVANLCVLTLDRYTAVVKPLRYIIFMTHRRICLLITMAWTAPVPFYLLPRLSWVLHTHGSTRRTLMHIFNIYVCLVQILTCVALAFATVRILRIARRHVIADAALVTHLRLNNRNQHWKSCLTRTREGSSAKVVFIVVVFYILTYSIDIYDAISCSVFSSCNTPNFRIYMFRSFWIFNSAVNPIAYAFLKRDMRKELNSLLRVLSMKLSN